MSGPLTGIGVIVTRPARQAAAFSQKLAALGATAIAFPAIVILPPADRAPLERAQRELDHYDAAIFVSANAAEYGVPPTPWPPGVKAFAPGPGSAAALTNLGVRGVRFPGERHDSEGLLALPELADVRGKRILLLRGEGGRDLLLDTLRARGASVDVVACYRRAPPVGVQGLVEVLAEGRAQALTLTSSEGVANLCDALDATSLQRLSVLPAFASHPRIAEAARARGLRAVETGSGDMGLVAALLQWFDPPRRSS